MGDWIAQNLSAIFQGAILTVFGFFMQRVLRRIFASNRRTEEHVAETAKKLSDLDKVSVSGWQSGLEEWQKDMALRIAAAADNTSDSLAWQATFDRTLAATIRRVAAVEQFCLDLDAFAHGHAPVPTFTAAIPTTTQVTELQEEHA